MKANDGVMSLDIWFLVNFFLFLLRRLRCDFTHPYRRQLRFIPEKTFSRREYTDARTSLLLELCQVRLRKRCGRDEFQPKAAGVLLLAITPVGNKSATHKEKKEVRERENQRELIRDKRGVQSSRIFDLWPCPSSFSIDEIRR